MVNPPSNIITNMLKSQKNVYVICCAYSLNHPSTTLIMKRFFTAPFVTNLSYIITAYFARNHTIAFKVGRCQHCANVLIERSRLIVYYSSSFEISLGCLNGKYQIHFHLIYVFKNIGLTIFLCALPLHVRLNFNL